MTHFPLGSVRARSFQLPVEVPGVSNMDFLRPAGNASARHGQARVRLCTIQCREVFR